MVRRGSPLAAWSSLASGALAPLAPMVWEARWRVMPAARISWYSPARSSRVASSSTKPRGSQLRMMARGWGRRRPPQLRGRGRPAVEAPAGGPPARLDGVLGLLGDLVVHGHGA